MKKSIVPFRGIAVFAASMFWVIGCSGLNDAPPADPGDAHPVVTQQPDDDSTAEPSQELNQDVQAAKALLDRLGAHAQYTLAPSGVLTEIVIRNGFALSADDIALFGKLVDLTGLQIYDFREMNDEMAAGLVGLTNLTTLAITNSVITDATVEMVATSFPALKDLDLSSNTLLTNRAMRGIAELERLERLTLVQNRFNDLGTSHLAKLENLRALDLRGNMEAGNMTVRVVGAMPKLVSFRHRSTTVDDFGMESLGESDSLESLLIQDFMITSQAGQHIAGLSNLAQLEVFRCQGFGSDGVLALAGTSLTRLTLRDLPMVDDRAMEVFASLPGLQRLYLHELASVSDHGLENLGKLESLELLDIWELPQMTDATIEVIAGLPNLKRLLIRTTGVTDGAVDRLLEMRNLESLTFKENGMVTAAALQKLSDGTFRALDIGQ